MTAGTEPYELAGVYKVRSYILMVYRNKAGKN